MSWRHFSLQEAEGGWEKPKFFVAHGDPRARRGCLDFFQQDWSDLPGVGFVHCLILRGLDFLFPVAARTEPGS